MDLYDQHLHSRHSVDSDGDPVESVCCALDRGLAGLTFTEHFDVHSTEWPVCVYDYDQIAQTIATLRARFGDRIFVGQGIEICYQPDHLDRIFHQLDEHEFDLVLLSVHWFAGRALHERDHWDGLDADRGTRLYLETVLDAARFVLDLARRGRRPFDVLGHLDLVKRYTQRYFGTYDIRSHADLIDEILRTCLEADLIPEVNLSTLRQSLPESSPADWVVRRYAELGGHAMSLGSDAHKPEDVGAGLTEAADMLKAQGITHLAVFKGRQRHELPL